MKDYSLGKIYRIVGNGFTYYGSTCEPTLARRLAKHRGSYKAYLKGNSHFVTSYKCFENDNDDYDIILVENYCCNSKDELHARERYYIENFECVNKFIVGRTPKEYNQDHKEKIKKRGADYRESNKEKIKKQRADYRESNKEKIKKQKSDYREENKEKVKEKQAEFYQRNKDKIKEHKNQKHVCECGGMYTHTNKSIHLKTEKHQNWQSNQ